MIHEISVWAHDKRQYVIQIEYRENEEELEVLNFKVFGMRDEFSVKHEPEDLFTTIQVLVDEGLVTLTGAYIDTTPVLIRTLANAKGTKNERL